MRVIIDLPDTADLEAVASELASSNMNWRNRLGFELQRAIQAAVRQSMIHASADAIAERD